MCFFFFNKKECFILVLFDFQINFHFIYGVIRKGRYEKGEKKRKENEENNEKIRVQRKKN
jgi:cell division protein FtsB